MAPFLLVAEIRFGVEAAGAAMRPYQPDDIFRRGRSRVVEASARLFTQVVSNVVLVGVT